MKGDYEEIWQFVLGKTKPNKANLSTLKGVEQKSLNVF